MFKNKKDFSTVFAFSQPKMMNLSSSNYGSALGPFNMIASTHYIFTPIRELLLDPIIRIQINEIFSQPTIIVFVLSQFENMEKDHFEYNPIFKSISSRITIVETTTHLFFGKKSIEESILKNKNLHNCIFIFENLSYRQVVNHLAMLDLIVSGGSNSKKHILSPIQMRLARFIIGVTQPEQIANNVSNSFHFEEEHKNEIKSVDWTNKDIQNWISEKGSEVNEKLVKQQLLSISKDSASRKEEIFNKKEYSLERESEINTIPPHLNDLDDLDEDLIWERKKEIETNIFYKNKVNLNINKIGKETRREFHTFSSLQEKDKKSSSIIGITIANSNQIKTKNTTTDLVPFVKLSDEKRENKFSSTYIPLYEKSLEDFPHVSDLKKEKFKENPLNFYMDYIREILSDSTLSPKEAQSRVENLWIELMGERIMDDDYVIKNYPNKLFKSIKESKTTFENVIKRNTLKRKFPELHEELNNFNFILMAFVVGVTYANRLSYTSICQNVGKHILDYLDQTRKNTKTNTLYSQNKENNVAVSLDVKENIDEYLKLQNSSNRLEIKIGDFFIDLLTREPHDLFERNPNRFSYYNKEGFDLTINSNYLNLIRENIVLTAYSLPMLCKPNPWSESSFGGYLDNASKKSSLITGSAHHGHKMENRGELYKAINYLSNVEFEINTSLLDYINNEGSYLLENLKKIEPENQLSTSITLKIAKLFAIYKNRGLPFYLPVNADWRGRIYTQSFFITYQGGDLSSALLNFKSGEILTKLGKNSLYIHGANNHNEESISKDSFDNRIKWVQNNYDKIINLDKDLIASAEKPFTFLAFCLNMKELHKNPNAVIKTPVFLDATCSGIQHFSALLLDVELATAVNVLQLDKYIDSKEKPSDIYSELLIYINKAINKYGEDHLEFEYFKLIKLRRSDIKTSVMTKVYNVTHFGIAKQLESVFKNKSELSRLEEIKKEIDEKGSFNTLKVRLEESLQSKFLNKNRKKDSFRVYTIDNSIMWLTRQDIFKIAEIINNQIFVVYPSLNNIYSYFIEMSKMMIKLGVPITWVTPAGLKLTQRYLKSKQSVITTKLFNKTKKMVIKEYTNETNKLKQSNAIVPNIIHSLDATHLIKLINKSGDNKFEPVITIHDCFGTLPNQMDELTWRVKREFLVLYSKDNFLELFHNRLRQTIYDNKFPIFSDNEDSYVINEDELIKIPKLPKLGNLDLDKIMNSKYFLS